MMTETVDLTMLAKLNFIIFWKHLVDKSKKVRVFGGEGGSGVIVSFLGRKIAIVTIKIT